MKLMAEMLEAREVPATFWWAPNPADLSAAVPTNWMKGPSGPVDQWNVLPGPSDTLHFQNTPAGNYDCTVPMGITTVAPASNGNPQTAPTTNTFAGVHLVNGYTKTVEFQKSVAVGSLELQAPGNVKQNDLVSIGSHTYAGNLWVTSALTWNAGTLNSGAVAGGVIMAGATGMADPTIAAPDDDCTVGLGSTFTLAKNAAGLPSTLSIFEGTYKLLRNAAGFVVAANSTLLLKAPVEGTVRPRPTPGKIKIDGENKTKTATTKGSLEVKEDGIAAVKAANRTQANQNSPAKLVFSSEGGVSELKNAGTVILEDLAWVRFDHTAKNAEGEDTYGGYTQSNPQTPKELLQIEAGCKITCVNRAVMRIVDGNMELTEKKTATGTPLAIQPPVVIEGSEDVAYALTLDQNTKLRWGTGRSVPIKLDITGDFAWTGDIELFADHTAFKNDVVEVNGRIIVNNQPGPFGQANPKLRVKWFDETTGNPVVGAGPWTMVFSEFTNAPGANPVLDAIESTPAFDDPPLVGTLDATLSRNANKNKIELKPD